MSLFIYLFIYLFILGAGGCLNYISEEKLRILMNGFSTL